MDNGTDRPESRPIGWWSVVLRRAEEDRLAAALAASEIALGARIKPLATADVDGVSADTVRDALRHARKAYARGAFDEAWYALEEAQRLAVFAAPPDELRGRAGTLRHEATHKLRGWRQLAVVDLCDAVLAAEQPRPAALYDALLLRDGFHHNQYFQLRLLGRQFRTVAAYIGVALVAMYALAAAGRPMPMTLAPGTTSEGATVLVWMTLFGTLGAAFSLAFPLTSGRDGRRTPDHIGTLSITAFRPLLGAAAGPVAYAFAQAEILGLPRDNGALLLMLAFAAGFSERLILRAVGMVLADSRPADAETGRVVAVVDRDAEAVASMSRDDSGGPGARRFDGAAPRRAAVALTPSAGEAYRVTPAGSPERTA